VYEKGCQRRLHNEELHNCTTWASIKAGKIDRTRSTNGNQVVVGTPQWKKSPRGGNSTRGVYEMWFVCGAGDWIGVAHDVDHRRTASKHGNAFVGTVRDG
jgi:type IV secretory pathway TrbL component